ncbi:unnamed protein product [Echinostoma caproni]|uniref:G_PROTEIN_RECEP_F1_2 domain-containing protein n=1 Tax=Echinostoma caproni TaxID=27848 RepID=A0A183AVI1_9TREM|nr:unnamed protein product [Echinostoma caproni]
MFAILFAITRNFMIVPFWWISYRSLSTPGFVTARQAIPWLVVAFVIPPLILDYLNLYWAMKTYRIGWRAAKCLWNADWRSDIRRAHARLRKRLRRIRRRTSSDSASAQTAPASVTTAVASGMTSSSMDNLQRLPDLPDLFILESSSSSSNYSSETEYEPADSEHEFGPLKTAADKSLADESPLNRTVPDQEDQHITQRAAPTSSE